MRISESTQSSYFSIFQQLNADNNNKKIISSNFVIKITGKAYLPGLRNFLIVPNIDDSIVLFLSLSLSYCNFSFFNLLSSMLHFMHSLPSHLSITLYTSFSLYIILYAFFLHFLFLSSFSPSLTITLYTSLLLSPFTSFCMLSFFTFSFFLPFPPLSL